MFTHTENAQPRSWNHASRSNTRQQFSALHFAFGSNLSPQAMKGRHPDSLCCGLAKLNNWRWMINSTGFANIVPCEGHVVYGTLYFITSRDEADLDEDNGVPAHNERKQLEVVRLNPDGSETEQKVEALTYLDVQRLDDGTISPSYVVWIRKAIRDAKVLGLPDDYVAKTISPWLPATEEGENEWELEPIRMVFSKDQFK